MGMFGPGTLRDSSPPKAGVLLGLPFSRGSAAARAVGSAPEHQPLSPTAFLELVLMNPSDWL